MHAMRRTVNIMLGAAIPMETLLCFITHLQHYSQSYFGFLYIATAGEKR